MAYQVAMARAWRGEPWRCVVVQSAGCAAFLTAEDQVAAMDAGEIAPIGFPAEDVYEFDLGIFDALCRQWESQHRTDDRLWHSAVPFGTNRAAE
jgi:hypothetical protein